MCSFHLVLVFVVLMFVLVTWLLWNCICAEKPDMPI
jgi:hypothetical protein